MEAKFVVEDDEPVSMTKRFEMAPVLVATTNGQQRNLFKAAIAPMASCHVDDMRFDYDSSFVRPEADDNFKVLSLLLRDHPCAPLSIFGHADPVGRDDYNKKLSGRRAAAIYAVLVRDVELWEMLYTSPHGHDEWGTLRVQEMLANVGYYPGELDGDNNNATTIEAIRTFQSDFDLKIDGVAGPDTRKKLYATYMNAICVDWRGRQYQLKKEEFLAQGVDKNGKGDYQGCGEFNPELVFSKQEAAEYEKSKVLRNTENQPNRRVVIFLFIPGSRIEPKHWPCPCAKDGVTDCKKRLWADGGRRRGNQEQRRKYSDTRDTYACRFYERIYVSNKGSGEDNPDIEEFYGRPMEHDGRSEKPHQLFVPIGTPVVLHWRIKNAERIRIECTNHAGQVSNCEIEVTPKGSADTHGESRLIVTPTEDVVYALFASNKGGTTRHNRYVWIYFHNMVAPQKPTNAVVLGDTMQVLPQPTKE